MKIQTEVIEKLKKILALAGDKAAQPGEVEAAMVKAKEIAIAHNIELASIDLSTDEKAAASINIEKDSTLRTRTKFQDRYHRWVFAVLQTVFHVTVIRSGHPHNGRWINSAIHLVGESVDVAIAKAVFPFLEETFPAIFRRLVREGSIGDSIAEKNGCYRGIYEGIVTANKREEAKAQSTQGNPYALVVRRKDELIQAAMTKYFPDIVKCRNCSLTSDELARFHGHQEGSKINLRQVNNGASPSQLH